MDKPRAQSVEAAYERPLDDPEPGRSAKRALPAMLLAAVFVALGLGAAYQASRHIDPLLLPAARQDDNLSTQERDRLARDFAAAGPLTLEAVRLDDIDRAIFSMGLAPDQQKAVRDELATLVQREHPTPQGEAAARYIREGAATAMPAQPRAIQVSAGATAPQAQPEPQPAPAAAPPRPLPPGMDTDFRLPMAWITLWDHVDEDGDIVRVISTGYSRTVSILHQPVTLAIPAPPGGIVNVLGVRDGVGGITVGIKSATMGVALPVLSEGQIVGVPVVLK